MAVKNYSFPRQAISDSEKDLEWCKENLRAITKYVGNRTTGYDSKLAGRDKDIQNYKDIYFQKVLPMVHMNLVDLKNLDLYFFLTNLPMNHKSNHFHQMNHHNVYILNLK